MKLIFLIKLWDCLLGNLLVHWRSNMSENTPDYFRLMWWIRMHQTLLKIILRFLHSYYLVHVFLIMFQTSFHFDVEQKYFHQALDIFAQFFIHPLLRQDSVDREIQAVDSGRLSGSLSFVSHWKSFYMLQWVQFFLLQ